MGITLDGAYLCSRAALPHLMTSGAGRIVNIGGLSSHTGASRRAHVIAAKAGLSGLTRALAHDLAARNVTVNCVAPGLIETVRAGKEPAHHAVHRTAGGRRGTPEDVCRAGERFSAAPTRPTSRDRRFTPTAARSWRKRRARGPGSAARPHVAKTASSRPA